MVFKTFPNTVTAKDPTQGGDISISVAVWLCNGQRSASRGSTLLVLFISTNSTVHADTHKIFTVIFMLTMDNMELKPLEEPAFFFRGLKKLHSSSGATANSHFVLRVDLHVKVLE